MSVATQAWHPAKAEYFADHSAVSHSMLEVFRRNVAEYHGRFVDHSIPEGDSTDSQEFGTMTHMFVLEPELFASTYCVMPPAPGGKWDRRSKAYKEAVSRYEQPGWTLIEYETKARLDGIRDAIERHPLAQKLLDRSPQREVPIRWIDPISGLECKCLVDALGDFILDLKTCRDLSRAGFKRAVRDYGYHRQSPHYQAGVESRMGERVPHSFVCVSTEPPYECALYPIGPRTTWLGEEQNRADLVRLAERMQSGDWINDYARGLKENEVELDNWEFVKQATET